MQHGIVLAESPALQWSWRWSAIGFGIWQVWHKVHMSPLLTEMPCTTWYIVAFGTFEWVLIGAEDRSVLLSTPYSATSLLKSSSKCWWKFPPSFPLAQSFTALRWMRSWWSFETLDLNLGEACINACLTGRKVWHIERGVNVLVVAMQNQRFEEGCFESRCP